MAPPLFELQGLVKHYGGVHALQWTDADVVAIEPGDVLGLAGENGAGKSTVLGAIAGSVKLDSGVMRLDGSAFLPGGPFDALARGVALIPQETLLAPTLTVAENVLLGREREFTRMGVILGRRRDRLAREALEAIGLELKLDITVSGLQLEYRKMIELARALAAKPRVLLVDETSNALSRDGADILFKEIAAFAANGGGVIFVTHRLDEIIDHCNRVAILKDGTLVGEQVVAETNAEKIARAMVGRALGVLSVRAGNGHAGQEPEPVLEVVGLRARGCQPLDLTIRAGEIVGIGGLVGCGSDAVIRSLAGIERAPVESLRVRGKSVRGSSVRSRIDAGITYVPRDRDEEGLLLQASVYDNIVLANLDRLATAGLMMPGAGRDLVRDKIRDLAIKTPSDRASVGSMSGGNRQKILLARWLSVDSPVMLLNNPTRGVDVGAKNEIYAFVDQAREQGRAALIVSDELPELRRLADRVLIMRHGEVTGTFSAPVPEEHDLIGVML
jgi:ABC-type sugar transport system ATPase subunit